MGEKIQQTHSGALRGEVVKSCLNDGSQPEWLFEN